MASKKVAKAASAIDNIATSSDEGTVIPRLRLGETGFLALRTINRQVVEEQQRAFRYPAFIKTVQEMRNNPTVGAAMNVYRMMISRVKWNVKPHVDSSQKDIDRAKLIETMMHDMEDSWASFIESVIPYLEYGFAVNEIVLRRRTKGNGSKYTDGLVGIKNLPTRNPESVTGWKFSPDGSQLLSIEQTLTFLENGYLYMNRTNERGKIEIPREKILLFTASKNKGDPQGNSIYKNIYLAFKQLTLLQDQELVGIAKDIQGILKIGIPPKYLSAEASADDKAVATAFQTIIDNYNAGTQRGLLVPLMVDPESKTPMFTYDLMETKGQSKYDTEGIIKRLQGDILSALSVDILKLGADGGGSFSLAESKSSVLALAIDYRLREMADVLNTSLMPLLFQLNGWDLALMPEFSYDDVEEPSLDDVGKYIQRTASVGLLPVTRPVVNKILEIGGFPVEPDDAPVDHTIMSGATSKAGAGMATAGDGTSTTPFGSKDSSANNSENAA